MVDVYLTEYLVLKQIQKLNGLVWRKQSYFYKRYIEHGTVMHEDLAAPLVYEVSEAIPGIPRGRIRGCF